MNPLQIFALVVSALVGIFTLVGGLASVALFLWRTATSQALNSKQIKDTAEAVKENTLQTQILATLVNDLKGRVHSIERRIGKKRSCK